MEHDRGGAGPAGGSQAAPRRTDRGRTVLVAALLHAYPWARLVLQPGWPTGPTAALSVLAAVLAIGLPAALLLGHGRGVRWAVARG